MMTTYTLNIYEQTLPDGRKRIRKTTKTNSEYGTIIGIEYRLVADLGKVLTDGKQMVNVIDTADLSQWSEINKPTTEPEEESND